MFGSGNLIRIFQIYVFTYFFRTKTAILLESEMLEAIDNKDFEAAKIIHENTTQMWKQHCKDDESKK